MTVTAANTHDITQAAALIREDDVVAILHRNRLNLAQKRLIPRMGTELTRFNQRFLSSAKTLQHFIVLEGFGPSDRIRTCGILHPNLCLNLQAELCRTLWHFPALLRFLFGTLLDCLFQPPLSAFGICVGLNSVYLKCFRPGLHLTAGAFCRREQLRNCAA